jgi:hypothetical protein
MEDREMNAESVEEGRNVWVLRTGQLVEVAVSERKPKPLGTYRDGFQPGQSLFYFGYRYTKAIFGKLEIGRPTKRKVLIRFSASRPRR